MTSNDDASVTDERWLQESTRVPETSGTLSLTAEAAPQELSDSPDVPLSWPDDSAFSELNPERQFNEGAYGTRVAVVNEKGLPTLHFAQGEWAHFFFEFVLLRSIEVPAGGLELKHESGAIVFGKNSFQELLELPESVSAGTALRFHYRIELRLMIGVYSVGLGLAEASPRSLQCYREGTLSQEGLSAKERSRVVDAVLIYVNRPLSGRLTHHGFADLPGNGAIQIVESAAVPRTPEPVSDSWPTLLHVTHWKAGSQWISNILRQCAPGRIVEPRPDEVQVRHFAIQTGWIYPTVYLSRDELDRVNLPPNTRSFVVIRDLRDTLVSAYFSFKISHPILNEGHVTLRKTLLSLDVDDGMAYMMKNFLPRCAAIQLSWIESDGLVLKYEHLVKNDVQLLTDTLIGRLGLPLDPEVLKTVIVENRFEARSAGRIRGQEDLSAHERKGEPGDWRNYFTDKLKRAFKARFGGLLVESGYESSLDW